MTTTRMSAAKSRLLAYLKHTPGFEKQVWDLLDLDVPEILTNVARQDPATYHECIRGFGLTEPEDIPA